VNIRILSAAQPLTEAVGRKLSRVVSAAPYVWELDGAKYRLVVQENYLFNGASIPWPAWSALQLAPHGIMDGPSLPHDLLYEIQGQAPPDCYFVECQGAWVPCETPISRELADELLRVLCIHFNACGRVRAFLVWSAVRVFGHWAWYRDDGERKDAIIDQIFVDNMEAP
jgi:hypothetical protein